MSFVADITVGLAASAALGTATWSIRYIRDARIRRRFPVAGKYASAYEDAQEGGVATVKATAWFDQRGNRLWGKTQNLVDGREWILEAHIAKGGRIYGTYHAADPHDAGLGGFFLELVPPGNLDGVWAGYDTKNKRVEAGAYRFRSIWRGRVREMVKQDVPPALAILGEALGRRYVTRETLLRYVQDSSTLHAFVADDEATGKVVGACTGEIVKAEFLSEFPAALAQSLTRLAPILEFNTVGCLRSLAIGVSARGHGIGTQLAQSLIDALWDAGATCIVTVGWTDKFGCHIQGVVETLGFHELCRLPELWREDSVQKDYECPTCGQPCVCEGRLFILASTDDTRARSPASVEQ